MHQNCHVKQVLWRMGGNFNLRLFIACSFTVATSLGGIPPFQDVGVSSQSFCTNSVNVEDRTALRCFSLAPFRLAWWPPFEILHACSLPQIRWYTNLRTCPVYYARTSRRHPGLAAEDELRRAAVRPASVHLRHRLSVIISLSRTTTWARRAPLAA